MSRQLDPNSISGRIRDLLSRGKTPKEVATELGVPPSRVYTVRKQQVAQQLRISKITGKPVRKYTKQPKPPVPTIPKTGIKAAAAQIVALTKHDTELRQEILSLQAALDVTRKELEAAQFDLRAMGRAREAWVEEAERRQAALDAAYARIATLESATVSRRVAWLFGGVK